MSQVKDILNVVACQCGIVWEDPVQNMKRLDAFVQGLLDNACPGIGRPDLLVLPEFFATGFTSDISFAEEPDGPTLEWMRRLSRHTGAAVTGSVPVIEGGKAVNRMYFTAPDGRTEFYDKRHLFRMGGENGIFEPGRVRKSVEYLGWRIGLNVCYDLRFPVWTRRTSDNDYDILLNVASWPSSRIDAASVLVRARAVENQSWTVFCNRVGESPENSYSGGSLIVDYKGRPAGKFIPDDSAGSGGGFLCASMDIRELRRFREKFPAWMDSDRFNLE